MTGPILFTDDKTGIVYCINFSNNIIWFSGSKSLDSGAMQIANANLRGIAEPKVDTDATTKKYVDGKIAAITPSSIGALASGGTAASATKLETSRTIQTNLGSTSTASFNGTANITPGVTGTLGIANGGTGSTTASGALNNLGAAGKSMAGQSVKPTSGTTVTAGEGAEIFNDFRDRIFSGTTVYAGNVASGAYSHAEGGNTTASGVGSHAEGGNTTASIAYSHAEGYKTTAGGVYSHAEGNSTTASGK